MIKEWRGDCVSVLWAARRLLLHSEEGRMSGLKCSERTFGAGVAATKVINTKTVRYLFQVFEDRVRIERKQ